MSKNNPDLLSESEAGDMVIDELRPKLIFLREKAKTAPLHVLDDKLDEIEELGKLIHQIVNGRRFTRTEIEKILSR